MTVTLNQILAMENVLATRDSKEQWITLGDQPLHYVLRILTKKDFKAWQLDKGKE